MDVYFACRSVPFAHSCVPDVVMAPLRICEISALEAGEPDRAENMENRKIHLTAAGDAELSDAISLLNKAGYEATGAVASGLAERPLTGGPASPVPQHEYAFWQMLVENSEDAVMLLVDCCKIKFSSLPVRFILGRSPDEMQGVELCEITHPEDVKTLKNAFETISAHPDSRQAFEIRLLHKDGTWHWLDVRAVNLLSIKPVDAVLLQLRDITLRKVTERAVFRREEMYRHISESLLSEIILVDLNGKILYMNEAAAAPMGGRPFIFLSRTLHDIFPKDRADYCIKNMESVIATGKNQFSQFTIPVGNARLFYLLDFQPVRDDAGKITSVLIINTDITALKKSEAAYLQMEIGLQRICSAHPCLFRTQAGRLVEANPEMLSLAGYDSVESLAAAGKVFPASVIEGSLELPSAVGEESISTVRLRSRGGDLIPVMLRMKKTMDPEGRPFIDGLLEDLRNRNISWNISK